MCRGLFCVATTRNVGQDLATLTRVGNMSATCRRQGKMSPIFVSTCQFWRHDYEPRHAIFCRHFPTLTDHGQMARSKKVPTFSYIGLHTHGMVHWRLHRRFGCIVARYMPSASVVVAHFPIRRNWYAWPALGLCVGWYIGELVVLLVRVLYLTVFAFACCIDLCCVLN